MRRIGIALWPVALLFLTIQAQAVQDSTNRPTEPDALGTATEASTVGSPSPVAKEGAENGGATLPTLPAAPSEDEIETPPPEDNEDSLDFGKLISELSSRDFWLTLLAALIVGGLGGLVYELMILQGNIEWPHFAKEDEATTPLPHALTRNLFDLGVLARIIVGGLAAVAAIWGLKPDTGLGLVAGALVVGSTGSAVFRSLQDRILATLALEDADRVRSDAALMTEKMVQASSMIAQVRPALPSPKNKGSAAPDPASPVLSTALQDADRLLTQATAIGEAMQKKSPRTPNNDS